MRVLHIVGDSAFGGGSIVIVQLAGLARQLGWNVDVLCTNRRFQEELRRAGAGIVELDVIWRDIRPIRDLLGLWRLFRFLKRNPYDLVHTHTSKAGFVGRLAARLAGIPAICHTVHGFAFHEASPRSQVRFYAFLERLAAGCCHRIFIVSEFHRQWALRLGIGDERKLVAISNGIPPERVHAESPRDQVRHSLGAEPDDVVLLTIGRLAPQKGVEDLLEAVPMVIGGLPGRRVHLWLPGDGPLRGWLEQLAQNLGIGDRVRFPGFRADVGSLLAASDIVVLPSLREGLSIALLEAMAAGKPIVATTIGSNREVTGEGEAALLVPPGAADALARSIAKLIADPALACWLAGKAREIYLARYTEQAMSKSYEIEYRALAGESVARSPMRWWQAAAKRGLDVVAAVTGLAILGPLMLLLAAAIRASSPGPALFRQWRAGRDGAPFRIFKFRTMFLHVPDVRNSDGSAFTGAQDPRVTPLGRWLRLTSLDELPQLLNVLKGDMSLVGPRPDQPDQLRFYTPEEKSRLRVKPGVTGLAQLSGRNSIPWARRKQLDLEYVRKYSVLLDLTILLKTIPYVLIGHGVYGEDRRVEQ